MVHDIELYDSLTEIEEFSLQELEETDSESEKNREDSDYEVSSDEDIVRVSSGSDESDLDDEFLVESLDWCNCDKCSVSPRREAVCCHDRPEIVNLMNSDCITEENFFLYQLMCEEGLQYNRLIFASQIRDDGERQKYLDKDFDNDMKRHICYRSFLVVVNGGHPIGRGVRVVLPQCVLTRIRRQYPNPRGIYKGFQPAVGSA